jgi:hypothetical protein
MIAFIGDTAQAELYIKTSPKTCYSPRFNVQAHRQTVLKTIQAITNCSDSQLAAVEEDVILKFFGRKIWLYSSKNVINEPFCLYGVSEKDCDNILKVFPHCELKYLSQEQMQQQPQYLQSQAEQRLEQRLEERAQLKAEKRAQLESLSPTNPFGIKYKKIEEPEESLYKECLYQEPTEEIVGVRFIGNMEKEKDDIKIVCKDEILGKIPSEEQPIKLPPMDVTRIVRKEEIIGEIAPIAAPSEELAKPKYQPTAFSSYQLGQIGEESIIKIITNNFKQFQVVHTGKTAHVGDIHLIDDISHIKYILEIKNKEQLTVIDMEKFKSDIALLSDDVYNIVGVFISLKSAIPKIGNFAIDTSFNIYITKNYVNKECLGIIFEYSMLKIMQRRQLPTVQYEIPANVYTLVHSINSRQRENESALKLATTMHDRARANVSDSITLIELLNAQKDILLYIGEELKDILPQTSSSLKDTQRSELKEYVRNTTKTKIKKKDLTTKFPLLASELAGKTLTDIIDEYKA